MLPCYQEDDLLARLTGSKVCDGHNWKADIRLWVRDILISAQRLRYLSRLSTRYICKQGGGAALSNA